jgi:hypothetical protein
MPLAQAIGADVGSRAPRRMMETFLPLRDETDNRS